VENVEFDIQIFIAKQIKIIIICVPISNAFLDVVINDPLIGPHHLHCYELAIYMINGNLGHMFG